MFSTFCVWHFLVVQLVTLKFRVARFRLTTATSAKHICQSFVVRDPFLNLDSRRGHHALPERSEEPGMYPFHSVRLLCAKECYFLKFAMFFLFLQFPFGVICTCSFKKIPQDYEIRNWTFWREIDFFLRQPVTHYTDLISNMQLMLNTSSPSEMTNIR